MKSIYMSLSDIIKELRLLGDSKATGSFFIVSDEQHSATFGFEKGRIVSLQCRLRFGEKAIPLIAGIKRGSCRFEQTTHFARKCVFANNDEVYKKIMSAREQATIDSPGMSSRSATQASLPPGKQPLKILSASQKAVIENVLVDELGPMGSIVMDSIEGCSHFGEIESVIREEVDGTIIANSVINKINRLLGQ